MDIKEAILKVDFLGGTDIEVACMDMCKLARKLDMRIETKFNGVTVWARPNDNPLDVVKAFHEELSKPVGYKIAQAR